MSKDTIEKETFFFRGSPQQQQKAFSRFIEEWTTCVFLSLILSLIYAEFDLRLLVQLEFCFVSLFSMNWELKF